MIRMAKPGRLGYSGRPPDRSGRFQEAIPNVRSALAIRFGDGWPEPAGALIEFDACDRSWCSADPAGSVRRN